MLPALLLNLLRYAQLSDVAALLKSCRHIYALRHDFIWHVAARHGVGLARLVTLPTARFPVPRGLPLAVVERCCAIAYRSRYARRLDALLADRRLGRMIAIGTCNYLPIGLAAATGLCGRVDDYLARGVSVDVNPGSTPLSLAVQDRHVACARHLLDRGADPRIPASNGYTPLHLACFSMDVDMVDAILSDGRADVNARAPRGHVPLHYVLFGAHADPQRWDGERAAVVVRMLLSDAAVAVNARDDEGRTPLLLATELKLCTAIIEALGAAGAT
jgi:hypothetical protein